MEKLLMNKALKKVISVIVCITLVMAFSSFLVGCNDDNKDNGGGGGGVTPEAKIVSMEIKKGPAKDTYLVGEIFNPNGLVAQAIYDDGGKKSITAKTEGFSYAPVGALKAGDEITISFGGISVKQAITVVAVESITVDRSAIPARLPKGAVDFSSLIVTAISGDIKVEITDFTIKVGEVVAENIKAAELATGNNIITVAVGAITSTFEVEAFNGYIVEADALVLAKDVTGEEKNFLEVINPTEGVGSNGKLRVVTNPNEPASGGSYLGDVSTGNVFAFHIWSDIETDARIILRAASGLLLEDNNGGWTPVEMGDMQFNKLFSIRTGTKNNMSALAIADTVILPGIKSETPDGLLWVNWQDVDFGEIPLKVGDNVIEFTVTSDYVNKHGNVCAANIDRIEVIFKD